MRPQQRPSVETAAESREESADLQTLRQPARLGRTVRMAAQHHRIAVAESPATRDLLTAEVAASK